MLALGCNMEGVEGDLDYELRMMGGSGYYDLGGNDSSTTGYDSSSSGYGSTSYGSTTGDYDSSSTVYGSTSYGSTTGDYDSGSTGYYGSTGYGSTGYGSTSYGSTSYGSTGYGSTSYGSTGDYDSTTGEPWDETTGNIDLGTECVPVCDEPPEECCVPACAAQVGPVQGEPANFTCPVAGMEYNCGLAGTDLFDCDDFAYACEMWGRNNGYNICQFYMSYTKPDGTTGAHQINIVEFEYATPGLQKYCFIEPQNNNSYACWIQAEGDPTPPGWAKTQACEAMGGAGTTCNSTDVQCDGVPNPNAGEVCFNTLPAVCSMFRNETGLCPYTFEPDHDCSGTDAGGDPCYWNCADDEVCGAGCNQCDPAPSGSTGEMVESCASIDGENLNCFWDCYDGEVCGDDCYECA